MTYRVDEGFDADDYQVDEGVDVNEGLVEGLGEELNIDADSVVWSII